MVWFDLVGYKSLKLNQTKNKYLNSVLNCLTFFLVGTKPNWSIRFELIHLVGLVGLMPTPKDNSLVIGCFYLLCYYQTLYNSLTLINIWSPDIFYPTIVYYKWITLNYTMVRSKLDIELYIKYYTSSLSV